MPRIQDCTFQSRYCVVAAKVVENVELLLAQTAPPVHGLIRSTKRKNELMSPHSLERKKHLDEYALVFTKLAYNEHMTHGFTDQR